MSDTPQITLLADLVGDLRADAEAAYNARQAGHPRGPVTGLNRLDEALGGFLSPGLHVLQAAPGAGKTAMAMQVAAGCQFPALIVSAEMPIIELFRRLIARETQTYLGKLKSGELGPREVERLAIETAKALPQLALMDGLRGFASPELIRDAAVSLRDRLGDEHCLVVLDSLHTWARSGRNPMNAPATDYDSLNVALVSAADIAAGINCPLLLVAHRNRAGQEKGGLHAAKGTGDIEYLAETLIDLERTKDERPDENGEVAVTAKLHKNRNGLAGTNIPLRFSGRLQEFRDADGEAAQSTGSRMPAKRSQARAELNGVMTVEEFERDIPY
jgi:replicative DNA helicase